MSAGSPRRPSHDAQLVRACAEACLKAMRKPEVEVKVTVRTYDEYLHALTLTLNAVLESDTLDHTKTTIDETDRRCARRQPVCLELTNGSCVTIILEMA